MDILITNNPACKERFAGVYQVEYVDATPLEVLQKVRSLVHLGHLLVTHPMAGGLPPGTTPCKSVIVSGKAGEVSLNCIGIVENAVERYTRHGDFYPSTHLESHYMLDLSLLTKR